ncbi:uncharacterized protein LOC135708584 [Ochlerotatus camptorhynchus]|uniref:uncharacterized protein LOC135708584 n=1 Tax=Ochlerotatus camptorhynchus TaxID=644619 RepID=UPI0031DBF1D5
MFAKVFFVAALAIASVSARPGFLGAPVAYSAPAVAYTAGYANVGDSAVVTSHSSQVINPAYAAYTAAGPLAYAAAPYAAHLAYPAPLAANYLL